MDANLPQDTINFILEECESSNIPVFFEPTDKYKSLSILKSPHLKSIVYASPNLAELRALAGSTAVDEAHDSRSTKVELPISRYIISQTKISFLKEFKRSSRRML